MFDLINVNVGGDGMPFSARGSVHNVDARIVANPRHTDRTDEAKAAKTFMRAIGNLGSFDSAIFAYTIAKAGPAMTIRVLHLFEGIINLWAGIYDNEGWTNDNEYQIAVLCKRLAEYMATYSQE